MVKCQFFTDTMTPRTLERKENRPLKNLFEKKSKRPTKRKHAAIMCALLVDRGTVVNNLTMNHMKSGAASKQLSMIHSSVARW